MWPTFLKYINVQLDFFYIKDKLAKKKIYVNMYCTVIHLSDELLKRTFILYIFFLLSFRLHWTILTIFTRFVICKSYIIKHKYCYTPFKSAFTIDKLELLRRHVFTILFINIILKVKSLKNDYLKSFLYPMCIYTEGMLYKFIDETKTR